VQVNVQPTIKREENWCERPWNKFLAAGLVVMSLLVSCAGNGNVAWIVECPVWSDAALTELGEAISSGEFPELEEQIGEQLRHCNAIEAALGNDPDCDPGTWRGRFSLAFGLECSRVD
tara:strand:- start:8174 stop:8527 length:354 start_codon:yes stop_codon:yes gene_type:complete